MKKWQEITFTGLMNVSVLLFGTGVFSIMVGDKSFNDVALPIIIGIYGVIFISTLSFFTEER